MLWRCGDLRWDVRHVLIEAAGDVLAAGGESMAVAELAGMAPDAPWDDLSSVVEDVVSDLGLSMASPGSDEARWAAIRIGVLPRAAAVLDGAGPSDFVQWLGSVWGPAERGELGPLLALSVADEIDRGVRESGDRRHSSSVRLGEAIQREVGVLVERFG